MNSYLMSLGFMLLINCLLINAKTNDKKHIDIEHVAKLINIEASKQKNFLTDFFMDNLLGICNYKCANGATPIQNTSPTYVPNINGCGSYNFHIDFGTFNMAEFDTCCNYHDGCYEDCGVKKDNCDTSFKTCLTNVCKKWSLEQGWGLVQDLACKSVVSAMNKAVEALGCTAFKNAQGRGCTCSSKRSLIKRLINF